MYYGYAYYCNGTTFCHQKYSKQYNKRISSMLPWRTTNTYNPLMSKKQLKETEPRPLFQIIADAFGDKSKKSPSSKQLVFLGVTIAIVSLALIILRMKHSCSTNMDGNIAAYGIGIIVILAGLLQNKSDKQALGILLLTFLISVITLIIFTTLFGFFICWQF